MIRISPLAVLVSLTLLYSLQVTSVSAADANLDNETKLEQPYTTSLPIFENPDWRTSSKEGLLGPFFSHHSQLHGRDVGDSQTYWQYAIVLERAANRLAIPIDSTTWVPDVIGYCYGTTKNPIGKGKLSEQDKELIIVLRAKLRIAFGKDVISDEESKMLRVDRARHDIPNTEWLLAPAIRHSN